jgi:hypothetical protein
VFMEIRQPVRDVSCDCVPACGWQHMSTVGVSRRYFVNGAIRVPRSLGVALSRRLRRYRPKGVSLGW